MKPALARRSLSLLFAVAAAGTVRGQALELDVVGGSTPGVFSLDLHPALTPFEFGAIAPSFNRGPTPLSLIDPGDPRSLGIGSDLFASTWFGFLGVGGHFQVGPLPMASVPAFQDLAIYFQGVTLAGFPTIVDRISNVDVMRLGIADTFRDRIVTFQDDRAFATVLPRTDRTWMIVGGARGALLAQLAHDTTSVYSPLDDVFTPGPIMTTPRSMHTQTQLNDDRWLLIGGVDALNNPQVNCEIYDPVADNFTAVAPMNVPRMGHSATLLPDGRVFVAGGLQAVSAGVNAIRDAVDSAEIYDPVANTWTPTPNLSVPRAAHAAILRPDGKVVLAGGLSWYPVIIIGWLPTVRASCDVYDPIANTISPGPSMVTARSFAEPIALGTDRYLCAGGISTISLASPGTSTTAAEIYDAAANTWTAVGPLASARAFHKGWALDSDRFMLAGGAAGDILTPIPSSASEVFTISTGNFTAGPPLNVPRAGPSIFLTPQGQVHVMGGGSTNNVITNTTEFYYF